MFLNKIRKSIAEIIQNIIHRVQIAWHQIGFQIVISIQFHSILQPKYQHERYFGYDFGSSYDCGSQQQLKTFIHFI